MSECRHVWVLDRPESDTWECLDCSHEGTGSIPTNSPAPEASAGVGEGES